MKIKMRSHSIKSSKSLSGARKHQANSFSVSISRLLNAEEIKQELKQWNKITSNPMSAHDGK